MNLQSAAKLVSNGEVVVEAGGPGSGRHPGFGEEGGLLSKYVEFMARHNPDMTQATQHYEHANKFFNKLGEGGKKVMHGFLNHMKTGPNPPGTGTDARNSADTEYRDFFNTI